MKYLKQYKDGSKPFEVTKDQALETILGAYKDTKEVRELLEIPGDYNCGFSYITVTED